MKRLSTNPVAEVEKPPLGHGGDLVVLLPRRILALVCAAASEADAATYPTAAFTGLRRRELHVLRWRDVSVTNSVIRG